MAKASRVEVLVEDERHQRFVRRYLYSLGYSGHDIHFEDLPSGKGSGEQWVRVNYAKAVRVYRARHARAETALVPAIDSDNGDSDRRTQQLQSALIQAALTPRAVDERIAHLIPKRNIETWILCLNGKTVDENTDYSQEGGIDDQIRPAAATFFA